MWCILIFAVVIFNSMTAQASAQPTYLRCQYAEAPNQLRSRYVIAVIDLGRKSIELRDHHEDGTTVSNYILERIDETFLTAVRHPRRQSDEWIEVDRVSGRISVKYDVTASADRLWNHEKRGIRLKRRKKAYRSKLPGLQTN
jgi:hypothetical protein